MSDSLSSERSRSTSNKITHLITIEGVKSHIAEMQEYISKEFSCTDEAKPAKFQVKAHFGAREENWLSLFLHPIHKSIFVERCTFRLLDVNLNEKKSWDFRDHLVQTTGWGLPKFFKLEDLSLPDDTICIRCEVRFNGSPRRGDVVAFSRRDPNLQNDLFTLFSDDKYADVSIIAGGKKFMAHRLLLRFRSDYFRALFDSGMEESNNNEIQIEDVDPEPFKYFLEFLYTGATPDALFTVAWDLLPLADRFGSETLKDLCEEALIGNLSATNAVKASVLAHLHCCSKLEKKSLPLIRENLKSLIDTEDWKKLDKFPKLLLRLVESFAN